MELTGNPLEDIQAPITELSESFNSTFVIQFADGVGITQYTFWMVIALAVLFIVVLAASKRVSIIPQGRLVGMVEYGYDAVCRNMGDGAIGHDYKKHMPFIATLFFFILTSNIIGLIPGAKTATGTLGVTWALSLVSFIYFNAYGIKVKGILKYLKDIAPSGLPKPIVPVIWFFELVSLIIRLLTLAVRLYGNMFAGHMILGIFAILTQVFILDSVQFMQPIIALPAVIWFIFIIVMYALECLVAFLQAYVFAILSAVYIGLAAGSH